MYEAAACEATGRLSGAPRFVLSVLEQARPQLRFVFCIVLDPTSLELVEESGSSVK
jgi:hypothetical protein